MPFLHQNQDCTSLVHRKESESWKWLSNASPNSKTNSICPMPEILREEERKEYIIYTMLTARDHPND